MDAYKLGFIECKNKVVEAFRSLDLSGITDLEPEEEAKGKDEGEGADGGAKTRAELVNAEEVIRMFKMDPVQTLKEVVADLEE